MYKHEIMQSVTEANDITNISTFRNLISDMYKLENRKLLEYRIKEHKKFKKQVMELLPEFDLLVMTYEYMWNKHRSKFTIAEREIVSKEFAKLKNL